MMVTQIDSGRPDARLYEVSEGIRWWTACIGDDGGVSISNSTLRELKPDGPTGKAILAAIAEAVAATGSEVNT